jgi:hypothetical protein
MGKGWERRVPVCLFLPHGILTKCMEGLLRDEKSTKDA